MCIRCDAGHLAELPPDDGCSDIGVPDGRARGVGAVPVVVTGGCVGLRSNEPLIEDPHVTGPDQLVVAGEGSIVRVVGRITEVAAGTENLHGWIRIEVNRVECDGRRPQVAASGE